VTGGGGSNVAHTSKSCQTLIVQLASESRQPPAQYAKPDPAFADEISLTSPFGKDALH